MKSRMRDDYLPLMRACFAAAALLLTPGLAAEAVAAPARGPADSQLAPQSVASLKTGEALLAAGQRQAAVDAFEASLAADPRNVRAYHGLARTAEADGLPGKAVRFYREALQIDPNDLVALELQGNAFMARGATARAEANLERLRKLCEAPCAPADRLATTIAKGPPAPALAAKSDAPKTSAKTASVQTPQP